MIQLFRYELRSQRKRFSVIALMIAISLCCYMLIDSFIVYANNRVAEEAKPLAWADIVLDSSSIWDWATESRIASIVWEKWIITKRISINTNITSSTDSRLVQVLWVENAYPLYGTITVKPVTENTFSFGQWIAVDEKTYAMLDDGKIMLGEKLFTVDGIIQENPWLTLNLFTQWRQAIVPLDILKETWLLRTGSRAEYEFLIKTTDADQTETIINNLRDDALLATQRDVDDYQWRVEQVWTLLDELWTYLLLVIFCGFLLVAVTSMLSIDEYLYRRWRTISIMQILWARKRSLLFFYGWIFVTMSLLAILFANLITTLIASQIQMMPIVAGFNIPFVSRVHGVWVTLILVAVARSLPLIKIAMRSPLSWLAESAINISTRNERILSISILIAWVLWVLRIIWESRYKTLILWGVLLAWFWIIRLLVNWLLRLGSYINSRFTKNFILFDAIRSTTRPWNTSILIASTLIVALSTTLLLTQFGGSFVERLSFNNDNQPNRYIINLTKDDTVALQEKWIDTKPFNIVLGRIVSINSVPLLTYLENKPEESGRWNGSFTREFNITTADIPPEDTIEWPSSVPENGISIDQEFAKDLGVEIWDDIVFSIAWREFPLTITSMRKTNRTNFAPFFFFQLNAEQFKDAPMNYFLTLTVPEDEKDETRVAIASILRPWVAFIEIDTIIWSIRTISERIIQIVQILLGVILLFTTFTTIVCVENMRYAKAFKMKLYGILWATTKETRNSVIYEYGYIVLLAILASALIGRGVAAFFIHSSPFLDRSRTATLQWAGVILAIILLNTIAVYRTMK